MAKVRFMQKQDLEIVKYIKEEDERVLLRHKEIKMRRRQYFSKILNKTRSQRRRINKLLTLKDHMTMGQPTILPQRK